MGVYGPGDWRCVICGAPEFQGCDCRDDELELELLRIDDQVLDDQVLDDQVLDDQVLDDQAGSSAKAG